MATKIQARRDTAANWTSTNPVLAAGEPGYETVTGKLKIGDGTTAWNSLAYFGGGGTPADLSITGRMLSDLARTGGWLPQDSAARPGISESIPRRIASLNTIAITSGTLRLVGGILIPGGRAVNGITFVSGNTALAGASNQWFALVDKATYTVLAVTTDDTTTAWAVNSPKTLTFATQYTPANPVEAYVGVLVAATTMPTFTGVSMQSGVAGLTPVLVGNSTTGLTTPIAVGATVTAPTVSASGVPYAFVA